MNTLDNFTTLGIQDSLIEKITAQNIDKPTPIQEKTIPVLLEDQDVIAQAKTGTGKTLAFILPMLQKIDVEKDHVQGLIVTPTRELAIQITAELEKLVPKQESDIHVLPVYGGQDVDKQIKQLNRHVHIVVATPGRLLDHVRRETIDLSKVSMLVLDEADQMLHIGFLPEVEAIIEETPSTRQTALFSATISKEVRKLAKRYLKNANHIQVQNKEKTVEQIQQLVVETTDRQKQQALHKTIKEYQPFLAIVFCRTKRRVSKLQYELKSKGYNTEELHGDLSQAKRERVMKLFREAKIHLLIATDVAARGLDVEGVTHVFNYDIPEDVESYIHRIGRTGRAGEDGMAITFVAPKDRQQWDEIEKGLQRTIERKVVEVADKSPEANQQKKKAPTESKKDRREQNITKNKERKQRTTFTSRNEKRKPSRKR